MWMGKLLQNGIRVAITYTTTVNSILNSHLNKRDILSCQDFSLRISVKSKPGNRYKQLSDILIILLKEISEK